MDYSAIRIREENILALRSFLLEGPDAWVPLQDELQKDDETAAGYMSLLYGAFNVIVRRRFAPTYTVGDIVRFVADLRIEAGEHAHLIDTLAAEAMIRHAVDAPPPKDDGPDDPETVLPTRILILLCLVDDAGFDRAGLERFIEDTTAYTEMWLAARREASAEPAAREKP